jgi:U2 small nuclear ribonucleoprotein A'
LAEKIAETVSSAASRATLTTDEPKAAAAAPGKAGRLMSKYVSFWQSFYTSWLWPPLCREEVARVKAAIADAKTIEEVRKLELELTQGFIPTMDSVGA